MLLLKNHFCIFLSENPLERKKKHFLILKVWLMENSVANIERQTKIFFFLQKQTVYFHIVIIPWKYP